jgi:hypothetical protein
MTTDRSGSRIRSFLDLSTNNLPQEVFTELTSFDGVVAYPTTHGALLWVPDDPQSSHDFADEPAPDEVLAVQLHARSLGCDYVLFDGDAEVDPQLPSWQW